MLTTNIKTNNNHDAKRLKKLDTNDLMQKVGTVGVIAQYASDQAKAKQQEQQQKAENSNNNKLAIADLLERIYHNLIVGESITDKSQQKRIIIAINSIFNTSKRLDIEICKHFNPDNRQCYIFNSSYWQPVNENILRQFLKTCVAKLSDANDERHSYADFQKKLYETFFMNLPFYQPVVEPDVVLLNLPE